MKADDFKNKAFEDMLKYAFQEASTEMIDEMPPCEEVEFSKEHEEKMRKLFAGKVRRTRYIKRISIIAAVMIVLFSISIITVQGFRIKFMNFILSFTESNTKITYVDETENKNSYEVGDIVLDYLPPGFALNSTKNQGKIAGICFAKNDKYIRLKIKIDVYESNIDTEKANAELLMLNGTEAFITEKDDVFILNWNDGANVFELMGNLEREELIKIAENIKTK